LVGLEAGMKPTFDAIVIGSGITGAWAAKELTEQGLKVLVLERGRHIEHRKDYSTEFLAPWEMPFRGYDDDKIIRRDYPIQSQEPSFNEWTREHFVNDRQHPYQTPRDKPFTWVRSYQLGGRSLVWGRQCYRWSDIDFNANRRDGHGIDWPIRYRDLAPWYDHVERIVGVSGSVENLPQLPDGHMQPPMALNAVEQFAKTRVEQAFPDRKLIIGRVANLTSALPGRAVCQARNICARGCSYGAYFSSQSSTLPAANATGNLTLLTDMLVEQIDFDRKAHRAAGVRVINTRYKSRHYFSASLFFLCAGSFNSVATLLRSRSEQFPRGLANRSGVLGKYVMDHPHTLAGVGSIPGFEHHGYFGNRPTSFIIPRFRNLEGDDNGNLRGYFFHGRAHRLGWGRGEEMPGLGAAFKKSLRSSGPWQLRFSAHAECLPRVDNRISLSRHAKDQDGLPQLSIEMSYGENETALLADAVAEARKMLQAVGATGIKSELRMGTPGSDSHEMGGARMGNDPKTSVVNGRNQTHDLPNLFLTDGACMASSACQNPSLTFMAITARAANYAAAQYKDGNL
jgi:choline dehydrogenase-like flavoprotein